MAANQSGSKNLTEYAKAEDVLVENLRETLKQVQRFVVLGLGSSLFVLLLVAEPHLHSDDSGVPLPGGLPKASRLLAGTIALTAYWWSGLLALSLVAHRNRIVAKFDPDSALLSAALTYPSILATKSAYRVIAALSPAMIFLVALLLESATFSSAFAYVGILIFVAPYVGLAVAFYAPSAAGT